MSPRAWDALLTGCLAAGCCAPEGAGVAPADVMARESMAIEAAQEAEYRRHRAARGRVRDCLPRTYYAHLIPGCPGHETLSAECHRRQPGEHQRAREYESHHDDLRCSVRAALDQ